MLRSLVQGLSGLRVNGSGLAQSRVLREGAQVSAAAARDLPQPLLHHVRTTFVLKRKQRVHLQQGHWEKPSRVLKARHFLYEFVEHTDSKKQEPLKVLLTTSVEGLGSQGDVVEVRPHKARKDLLLPGLAVYASPENLEKYANLKDSVTQQDQPSSPFALSTANLMAEQIICLNMNKNKPWVVEPWHIRVGFRKAGVIVPESAITLPPHPITGPDLSIQGKEFAVLVKINNKEETAVRFRINHYTTNPLERLTTNGTYYQWPSDPLFPEQAALLEEINRKYRKGDENKDENV